MDQRERGRDRERERERDRERREDGGGRKNGNAGYVMPRGAPCLKSVTASDPCSCSCSVCGRQRSFIGPSTRSPGRSGSVFSGNDGGCEGRG